MIDTMKQALERLTMWLEDFPDTAVIEDHWAVDALRKAIAEAEKESTPQEISDIGQEVEQKPVAWISDSPTKGNGKQLHFTKADAWRWSSNITPLYTAPPKPENELDIAERAYFAGKQAGIAESEAVKREWVSLTVNQIALLDADNPNPQYFAFAVQAKLKELNHA